MKRLIQVAILAAVLATSCIFPIPAQAALPTGFETQTIVAGLAFPTGLAFAPDGRLFVSEKAGAVRVIKNGQLLPAPLIQLTDVNTYLDRGLSGIAVDPNFATNHYIYLAYTYENTPGANYAQSKTGRIVRITVNGDTASESSKVVLVGTEGGHSGGASCENFPIGTDCIPSDSSSHSMGGLRFGPDGKLYAAIGDGANFDTIDPRALRAQNLDSLAGKLLRINTDGTGPADNPFYDGLPSSNRSKIYAYGFRNAYRFNFRPATGALYSGDVGWDTWEEINKVTAGSNYGWPCREGNGATTYGCSAAAHVNPFHTYVHDPEAGGAVTAGVFLDSPAYPAQYANTMVFGDYALNWMKLLTVGPGDTFTSVTDFMTQTDGADGPVEYVMGPDGYVYFISIYTGDVRRIVYTLGNRQPIAQVSATPTAGLAPLVVSFSSAGSSDPDGDTLSYVWNFGDQTTSNLPNPQHTYTANGTYNASVTVSDGHGGVSIRSLVIQVGNRPPVPSISSPLTGEVYVPGEVLDVVGSATDPENGTLAGSALAWKVVLHHNTHTHVLETHAGNSFQFIAPDHGDPDVYTEIELTAVDGGGLTAKTSINLYLNNSISPDGNMVQNNSFEEVDTTNPNLPKLWSQSGYGTNNAVFTYPITGFDGANVRGAKVDITGYVDGDAKWAFDPARVKQNKDYVFSDYYKATVPTRLIAEFGYINGTYTYQDLATLPVAANWTKSNAAVHTPAGARTLSIYHVLESNGSLSVDAYSLKSQSTAPPPVNNLIVNASLETASGAGTLPANWQSSKWGTNTATFTYPVAGQDGAKAARVVVSGYTNGDAKWYFQDVPVTSGVTYNFSDYYQSTAVSSLVVRFATSANVYSYVDLGTVPASTTWVQATKAITVPAGIASLTVFHLLNRNGSLTVDNFKLSTNTPPPADTTVPVPAFTNPLNGQTVSGTLTLSATATDNVGVAGVSFSVDNVAVGSEVLTSPYAQSWNTTTVVNGAHTLKVTARDAAGNIGTQTISVTVNNTVTPPPASNLIANPSFETANGAGTVPTSWQSNKWGTNTTTFTYPVAGQEGAKAAKVAMTAWTNGDAKWYFDDVPVTAGAQYTFQNYYKSSVQTELVVRYTATGGALSYVFLAAVPASTTWQAATAIFTPPAGTASATVFHVLAKVGNLTVDNYSLTGPGGTPPQQPTATFSGNPLTITPGSSSTLTWSTGGATSVVIDQGVGTVSASGTVTVSPATTTTYTLTATNSAGPVTKTVTIVVQATPPPANNLVINPSLETANGALPFGWLQGSWGTLTKTFTYPITGFDGVKAARVDISAYTDGDAKWVFDHVLVTPGALYTYADYYQSSVPSIIVVEYILNDNSYAYAELATVPAATAWTAYSGVITVPANVKSMTVFHLIQSVGYISIDKVSVTPQ